MGLGDEGKALCTEHPIISRGWGRALIPRLLSPLGEDVHGGTSSLHFQAGTGWHSHGAGEGELRGAPEVGRCGREENLSL